MSNCSAIFSTKNKVRFNVVSNLWKTLLKTHGVGQFIVENRVNTAQRLENAVSVLLTVYFLDQFIDLNIEYRVVLQLFFHRFDRRHDGRMVAAEDLTDIWERHIGDFSD